MKGQVEYLKKVRQLLGITGSVEISFCGEQDDAFPYSEVVWDRDNTDYLIRINKKYKDNIFICKKCLIHECLEILYVKIRQKFEKIQNINLDLGSLLLDKYVASLNEIEEIIYNYLEKK